MRHLQMWTSVPAIATTNAPSRASTPWAATRAPVTRVSSCSRTANRVYVTSEIQRWLLEFCPGNNIFKFRCFVFVLLKSNSNRCPSCKTCWETTRPCRWECLLWRRWMSGRNTRNFSTELFFRINCFFVFVQVRDQRLFQYRNPRSVSRLPSNRPGRR